MCWNPRYKDLFAVAYGSYDFLKQTSGLICCFTIKNPTWPEYSFTTESGVMCIDFHPTAPALIAVGCYDGTVMDFIFVLRQTTSLFINQLQELLNTLIQSGKSVVRPMILQRTLRSTLFQVTVE